MTAMSYELTKDAVVPRPERYGFCFAFCEDCRRGTGRFDPDMTCTQKAAAIRAAGWRRDKTRGDCLGRLCCPDCAVKRAAECESNHPVNFRVRS